jgi:chromosome segregation ATPase
MRKKKESDILRESYKGLENKSKEILIKNKELEKDYNKVYSDNVKLKSNLNKLNEEMENDKVIKEELEKENNILKERNDNLLNDKKELSQKLISIQDDFSNAQKELEKIKNINNDLMEQIKNYQNNGHVDNNKIIDDVGDANNRSDYEQAKKENDTLQKRVIQLNELIQDLNNQINSLNIKYQEQKKENKNLKEVSQALIEKQKNVLEQKDKIDHITPETHYIITKKSYNKLVWYLVSTVNPDNKNDIQINDYDNYKWVTELVIPQSILNRFNKFEDNDTKINDLNAYIQKMQNKLEQKEEEISKKDYANKKLNSQLQNKTANIKQKPFLLNKEFNEQNSHRMNKSNSNQIFTNIKNNANSDAISLGQDVEKYKNLLEQLNDCGEREIKYQNIITKLKAQLKSQDELQSGMNNINDISHHFDSNFIEDEKDDKNVIELLSDIKQKRTKPEKKENTKKEEENFLGILNDVPGNESDLDEVKLLKKQLEFLKDYIKEKDEVINGLIEQIKDLIKDLKWNKKNNQRVTTILTLLGYTPEEIKILIENKKGDNFNFKLIQKK